MRVGLQHSTAVRAERGFGFQAGVIALMVSAAFGGAPQARAADPGAAAPAATAEDTALEEIVVTARKRSESLHDIPATIVAIPATAIKENHLAQLDDLSSTVSNVNIFEAHDNSPAVTMRGIGAFEVYAGVGFYMNDVQLFEGQTVRPSDIARIEVLKGPQGTLYGGANIGGAIKYVTKDPTPTWQNEVTMELGSYRTANVEGILSGPITDKLGMRVSVYDDNHEGYIWDTYHQKTIGSGHDKGGRLAFLWEPESSTNVHLTFNTDAYNSQNENLQYRTSEINPVQPLPYTADAYRYSVDDFFIPDFVRKLFSSTLQVDHQYPSNMTLTSITSQFWSLNRGVTDLTKKPIPLDLLFQNQDQRVVSQELRLSSTAHSNLDWLVGLFVQQHKQSTLTADNNYTGDIPAVLDSLSNPGGNPPYDFDNQNLTMRQYAVFGDATYYLGDWQYEIGLRAEQYSSRLDATNATANDQINFYATNPNQVYPVKSYGPQSLSGNQLSPRLSVQYRASAETNIYGTVSRGFEPGTLAEQNDVITTIRPETATSYELGFKSKFAHGAQITGAVFLINYRDRLYQTMSAAGGGFQDIFSNIGDSRNTGVEMDFVAPLTQEFKLSGGVGTTRAVWRNVPYLDPQLGAVQGGFGAPPVATNIQGLTAPFTPAYSANLALDWNHLLSNGWKIGARVDGQAIGQSYWNPNDYARQKAYQLMNLGVHLDTTDTTWIAHVTNLTNTRYNSMFWDANDVGVGHSFAHMGRPTMITLSGTYRF